MADPISATTFSTNVAALTITVTDDKGAAQTLRIISLSNGPPALNTFWPCLAPLGKFKSNAADKRLSCGPTPCWETNWAAKYGYYHCPTGKAKFWDIDNVVSDNLMAIRNALAAACTTLGVNDLEISASDHTVVLPWADKKTYYGGTLDIKILDYRNL